MVLSLYLEARISIKTKSRIRIRIRIRIEVMRIRNTGIQRTLIAKINRKWIYLKKRCKARSRGRQWQPLEYGCPENFKIQFHIFCLQKFNRN
jgi:hypothetical protein